MESILFSLHIQYSKTCFNTPVLRSRPPLYHQELVNFSLQQVVAVPIASMPVRISLIKRLFLQQSPAWLYLGMFLFFSGCISARPDTVQRASPEPEANAAAQPPRAVLLRNEAANWAGTPHVLGGSSRAGVDCSALVQQVYSDVFDIALPRTTAQQSRVGALVHRSQLNVGDLIFYKINRSSRHVGIYVGNNEFLHASNSSGVTISSVDAPYWRKRFWKVKRILPPETQPTATGDAGLSKDQKRTGW